ncbi:MAG: hypothetical protein Q9160_008386 [Pyrenula sp. 1 TL-2023]
MSGQLMQRRSEGQPSHQDPTFVQQGEVDWVSLSNTVVSFTVGTLHRLSGAGVQEITYVGALQLATRFRLADIGYRRICEAVEKAQFAPAFAKVAYFGFGYRSFIHVLADSMSGTKCIALCASFSEAHNDDMAARVISSLWRAVGYPEDYQPSLSQFKCLVKACSGVLATTSFPTTMGMMLRPFRQVIENGTLPEASDPGDIARVLLGLFDISNGVRERITVIGGAECSFIAAISQWLFDFKIQVEDSQGKTLFVSAPRDDQVQVRIIYKENAHLSTILISESTFLLGARNELLRYVPDKNLRMVRTRVAWGVCLSRTFGKEFADLLTFPIALGEFLGGAARVYHALARGEADVAGFSREDFIDFVETSYGVGFVTSVSKIFPELSGPELSNGLRASLSKSVQEARSSMAAAAIMLLTHCECRKCCRCYPRDISPGQVGQLCIVTLAITILELLTTITSLEFPSELVPTEKGIYQMYVRNEKAFYHISLFGSHKGIPRADLVDQIFCRTDSSSVIMGNALCLFTGNSFIQGSVGSSELRTAVAESGICAYMDCLESMTTRPELLRKIHVMPGHIARGDRIFDSIRDCAPIPAPFLEKVSVKKAGDAYDISDKNSFPEELELTALVDELSEPGQLAMYYQVETKRGRVTTQPGAMSIYILTNSGLIACDRRNCDSRLYPNAYRVQSGWSFTRDILDDIPDRDLPSPRWSISLIWEHTNSTPARLLALERWRHSNGGISNLWITSYEVLRQDECIPCCTRYAEQLDHMAQDRAINQAKQDGRINDEMNFHSRIEAESKITAAKYLVHII